MCKWLQMVQFECLRHSNSSVPLRLGEFHFPIFSLRRVPDSQSDFICKSDCFLTSDLAELAGGLRQGRVHQNACRITQISDFNIQWETSQISQMTSQPMGIEDFLVIDGPMSQIFFTLFNITLSILYDKIVDIPNHVNDIKVIIWQPLT